jgi:peptide deformylase|tara:strand:- start:2171 stop:2749 length:579 start_codon:yes stop_codon:yes gene_type:complete
MLLPLKYYGDPVLRRKGVRVEEVTPKIKQFITDMLETATEYKGIGLAAQQVGEAIQLTVIDIRAVEDRPSTLELDGQEADPESIMPLTLVNPKIAPLSTSVKGPEGCLSFPEIFGDISRPEKVSVKALNHEGLPIEFACGGLLARVVQHETDHLHGILFIDRMDFTTKSDLREELNLLQEKTKAAIASDSTR